jgi:prepilin-type N-terminal cleavage/methylation domain-containing protein
MIPRRDVDDSGFTLVELLIVVVIMGIVIAVVCQALIIGIRLGPQTKNRTGVAANQSFLTDALSDDIANATVDVAVPTPLTQACTAVTWTFATITVPGHTVRYKAKVVTGAPRNTVNVLRAVDAGPDVVMLSGYCRPADIFRVAYANNTLLVELPVSAGPNEASQRLRFGSARRRV